MNIDLAQLRTLIYRRSEEIEKSVSGTGYLAKTVLGVGTFLLDNEGNIDLLTARQKATFDRFIQPLLESAGGNTGTEPAELPKTTKRSHGVTARRP